MGNRAPGVIRSDSDKCQILFIKGRSCIIFITWGFSFWASRYLLCGFEKDYCGPVFAWPHNQKSVWLSRYSLKFQQMVLRVVSITAFIIGIMSLILFIEYMLFFFPFVIFPLGIMYMARSPQTLPHGRTSIKDVGITAGNMLFAFVIMLVIMQQVG